MLSLAVVILLSVSAYQVEAACGYIPARSGCFYKGEWFEQGEQRIIDCKRMSCERFNTISWCHVGMRFDRGRLNDKCKIVSVEPCYEKAVLKSDESKRCPYPTMATGR